MVAVHGRFSGVGLDRNSRFSEIPSAARTVSLDRGYSLVTRCRRCLGVEYCSIRLIYSTPARLRRASGRCLHCLVMAAQLTSSKLLRQLVCVPLHELFLMQRMLLFTAGSVFKQVTCGRL